MFQVQQMLGDQAMVTGTDRFGKTGQTIVSTAQWDDLKARKNFSAATEDFDKAVEEFFRPLTEAAEKAAATQVREPDPAEYVVLSEGVEGVEGKEPEIRQLSQDSIILRLIEEGNTDRLVWVNDSTLGVLAKQ